MSPLDLEDDGYPHEFLIVGAIGAMTYDLENGETVFFAPGAIVPESARLISLVVGLERVSLEPVSFRIDNVVFGRAFTAICAFKDLMGEGWQTWAVFHDRNLYVRFEPNTEEQLTRLQTGLSAGMNEMTRLRASIRVVEAFSDGAA